MGNNQSSRSATPIKNDPCIDNIQQWHSNNNNEPFKRQYPLPTITNDHNRIKPRKQSSPAAVNFGINSARKPFARLFSRSNRQLPRNHSCFDTTLAKDNNHSPQKFTTTNNTNTPNTSTPNTTNTNNSPSSSFNIHYVHPLAPPSTNSLDYQMLPYENDSFSRHSIDSPQRSSNRDSISQYQLKLLIQQQQLLQQQQYKYQVISNRKYHCVNGSKYLLPCDDEEVDRLHLQHFMIRFAIQGNYLAPVSDVLRRGGRVLDIGCGPGSWSMEIAGEYPKSTIVGVDIVPIYPREIKPANCAFYQCNILNTLPFEDETFDYIFMRFMCQGVTLDKWSGLLTELTRVLKPNGWIEWVETDIQIHRPGPNTMEFNQKLIGLMIDNNQDPYIGRNMDERLRATDKLTSVSSTFVSCPGGQWAGKLGQLTIQSWKAYYQALRPLLCQAWGISTIEYTEKLERCWREADEYKTFENVHFSYARKRSKTNTSPVIPS